MDSIKRSIVKTITFRIIATVTTIGLVLIFTRNWAIAGTIGILDIISKLIIYYVHERAWEHSKWETNCKNS
jgi:uncharacterized membrane protein